MYVMIQCRLLVLRSRNAAIVCERNVSITVELLHTLNRRDGRKKTEAVAQTT